LLNKECEWNKDGSTVMDEVCGPAEIISRSEVKSAITKTKSVKAAGSSGVVTAMLRASGYVGEQWVTDLNTEIVLEGKIPSEWIYPSEGV
jgi:hypothetical protein